ncbi:unnamed protein product [Medioppia subpectinata]|uniref:Serine/threonine-protein phosphatase 4 regulatory subunit 3 n=1 Tax=Medioppia subpectinata TaxID=1979941 RepID=A0A7R9Q1U9_9ACAR|nr:unnamed protein product [Medioppia subpectinata]CAG2109627.1 unnamed protein product [Medioppia subpectinata]
MTDTKRRVKLYALNADRQWDDRGTGHVSSAYVDRLKGMSLLVKAESDGSLLLESKILADTAYQKQQETLIVWSEGDNYDLALSFQERAGCDEIWAKICQVQGKDPSVDITQEIAEEEDERFDDTNDTGLSASVARHVVTCRPLLGTNSLSVELPLCESDRLDEINELMVTCLPYPIKREKLAIALETESYIKKLLALFRALEEQKSVRSLHKLYDIFKNIFLLNKNPLFEVMLSDESLWDIIGVFEYDPSLPAPKRHREYLKSVSRFKEVIPLGNSELVAKIHQTYRVQYIQEVVLPTPSVFEENMLSTLSSFIFFNKVEIVSLIQEDEKFLRQLFAQLSDESTAEDKRRDLVLFLKEFCTFSQTLQPQNRENFFKALASLGILSTLEVILSMEDPTIKLASVDILTYVVEYSPSMVREYALQQENDEEQFITNIIIEQMICDSDPDLGMATQLSGIIKLLVDPENMLAATVVNKSEKTDFLNYFYKHCMHVLIAPVLASTQDDKVVQRLAQQQSGQSAQLLSIILELLAFCVEHHAYHIRNYILHRELLKRILLLIHSRHTFLVLTALRFVRKIIGLKDEFYNRHIIHCNLMAPIVERLITNNGRYNLLDSAIVELFEFVRAEEIKSLCVYIMEKFWKQLESIDYVRTFKGLKLQYEQHQDRLKDKDTSVPLLLCPPLTPSSPDRNSVLLSRRFRRDARDLEDEEEMWFNNDDDDDCDANSLSDSLNYKLEAEYDFNKKALERKNIGLSYQDIDSVKKSFELETNQNKSTLRPSTPRRAPLTTPTSQSSPSDITSSRKGLVDYDIQPDEDSDEESGDESPDSDSEHISAKRQRLSNS